jgi:hypothetical protein
MILMGTVNIMNILWLMMCFEISVINSMREIIFYGLQGRDVPIISYWGYVGLFIGLMIAPTYWNIFMDKR